MAYPTRKELSEEQQQKSEMETFEEELFGYIEDSFEELMTEEEYFESLMQLTENI